MHTLPIIAWTLPCSSREWESGRGYMRRLRQCQTICWLIIIGIRAIMYIYIIVLLHYNLKIDVNDNRFEEKHSGRSGLIILWWLSNVVGPTCISVFCITRYIEVSRYLWTFDIDTWWYHDTSIYRISNESMISQTILERYTSIEYRMKYRVSYDTILDPLSRVYTSNANLHCIP